jgi:hypothetical protein
MNKEKIKKILKSLHCGKLSVEEAYSILKTLPFEELGFAKIDHHRELRVGIPEVVLAEGKRLEDVVKIAHSIYKKSKKLLITRASKELYENLKLKEAIFHPLSKSITIGTPKTLKGSILIITAGTCDIPVADEAAVTASFLGSKVKAIFDVGVAGIHRIFDIKEDLLSAKVIVVVAGMEGALPSIVGSLVDKPVIAVPTSVGYGTSFNGLTALFSMLNSCVPGLAVVNIDNGFGAGCLAHKINILSFGVRS